MRHLHIAGWFATTLTLLACGVEGEGLFGESVLGGQQGTTSPTVGITVATGPVGQGGASSGSGVGGTFTVSSNNVTASSSVSASASTGGMNEAVCLPKDGDTKCSQCIKGQCCAELDVCAADMACACLIACTSGKQQNCYSKCGVSWDHPPWSALVSCRTFKCGFDCLGG